MVMHARKLPRLNDGYFERNQGHSYQGTGKYSSKNYNERYNEKIRDSPSNGGNYRNESPDSQHSPRDRSSYHNKSSYSQRVKERERDRHERDASRSPKEKASKTTGRGDHHHPSSSSHRLADNAEHRNNHDRNSTEASPPDKEKKVQVGDWSEHISSSGKKYYYNCKTEVSQWEKPKEWIEWERQQGKTANEVKPKERNYEKSSSASSSSSSNTAGRVSTDKHSNNDRNSRLSAAAHHHHHARLHDERHRGGGGGNSSSSAVAGASRGGANSQPPSTSRNENHMRGLPDRSEQRDMDDPMRHDGEQRRSDSRKNNSQMQDMDISPDSTPPSTSSQPPNSQPQSRTETPAAAAMQQQATMLQPTTSQGSVSIASLPKLLSQLAGNKGLPNLEKTELSAQEALQTLQRALLLTRQVSLAQTSVTNQSPHTTFANMETSPFLCQKSPLPHPMASHTSSLMPAAVNALPMSQSDDVRMRNDDERDRAGRTSPGSEYSHRSSRRDSPTSSVSSLHSITATGTSSLVSAALRPVAPLLTPSLANYFRDDLIKHVTGWQADHAERQANRYSEEAHSVGSLNSTKVSAELKMARSLVRVAEIQSTLQEQRILFLRQQIKELEEWKSQNSFMSNS